MQVNDNNCIDFKYVYAFNCTVHKEYMEGISFNFIITLCRYSPGSSSYALTVGGTKRNDNLYLRLFDGTNYGKCVDVFAPGQDILSAGIRGRDAVETMSGTSQATPLVSGVAAIHWSINTDASALDIKDTITSTCTQNKLKINAVVPGSFQQDTPNCLLFIDNVISPTNGVPDQVFYSVSPASVKIVIDIMQNSSYALKYIQSHTINLLPLYNLAFKYMADTEFITLLSPRLKELRTSISAYEENGYQLTLLHNKMDDSIENIALMEKVNLLHSHEYRLTKEKHEDSYQLKSSQGDSLLSTTVALNTKGELRYSSIYVHDNVETHHLPSVSISDLLDALDAQLSQGFYLSHLTTVPTNPPSYSVVFRKMTKPATRYALSKNLDTDQVTQTVQMQISNGFTPIAVARLQTPDGLKFVVSFEQ